MSKQRLIRAVSYSSPRFLHRFMQLAPTVLKEARRTIGEMTLIDFDNPPAKLHLHLLSGRLVASVLDPTKKVKAYSIHLTTNDTYKASLTFEDGCIYLRTCGTHDEVDRNP